jgi:DNA polymerase-4
VTELFDKLYQRRMRLRLIGIRFSGLVRGTYQINMFEDTEKMSLYQAMDRMKNAMVLML